MEISGILPPIKSHRKIGIWQILPIDPEPCQKTLGESCQTIFRKFLLTFSGFCISAEFRKDSFKTVYRREVPNRLLMSSESYIQNLSDQLFFSDLHFRKIRISAEIHFRGNGMWHKKSVPERCSKSISYTIRILYTKSVRWLFLFFLISAKFIFPRKYHPFPRKYFFLRKWNWVWQFRHAWFLAGKKLHCRWLPRKLCMGSLWD